MNTRSSLVFVILACAVGGGGFLLAEEVPHGAPGFQARDLPALLPDTCSFQVVIDGGPCVRKGGDLALTALLSEPEVATFVAPLEEACRGWLRTFEPQVKQYLGLTMDETLQLLRHRTTAAFCGFIPQQDGEQRAPTPDAVITLEFENEIEMVRRLMYALEKAVLAWGNGHFTDDTVAGLPVRRYVPDPNKPSTPTAWYLLDDRMLLLATHRPTLEGIVKRMKSGTLEGSLASSDRFKRVNRRVSGAGSILSFYADVPRLVETLAPMLGDPRVPDLMAATGLDAIKSVGYGLSVDGKGLRDRLFIQIDEGPLRQVMQSKTQLKAHTLVPHTTGIFASGQIDFGATWSWVHSLLSKVEPELAEGLDEGLLGFGEMIGADVTKDVLARLGPEFALAGWWPEHSLIPDLGIFLQVRERDALMQVVDKALKALDIPVSKIQHRDRTIGVVDLGPILPRGITVPLRPSWVFLDDHLVVTLWPQSAKNLVDHLADGGTSLGDTDDFKALLAHLRADDPNAATAGVGWVDLQGLVAFVCDNGVPLAQSLLPPSETVPVDWTTFPLTETITQHLFGMVGGSHWTDDGYYTEYYSPTGYLGPYMLSVGLAGLVMTRTMEAQAADKHWEARQRMRERGVVPFGGATGTKPPDKKKAPDKKKDGDKKGGGK